MRWVFLLVAFSSLAGVASAQMPDERPQRLRVRDLLERPSFYHDRVVLVVGELRSSSDMQDDQNRIYELKDPDYFRGLRVGTGWGSVSDLRFMQGQKVEVVGVFWDMSQIFEQDHRLRNYPGALRRDADLREELRYFLAAREVTPIEEERAKKEDKPAPKPAPPPINLNLPPATALDLRELVKSPGDYLGTRVSVVGKFRGDNLYGDLSIKTKHGPRDFVVKVGEFAIWVTGRRPRGEGFELNPELRRDTGKWLKVSGVPRVEEGVVYLKADSLELAPEPSDPDLEPSEAKKEDAETPKVPPEVTFSLPLDGERGIALDSEFRVQFSKDMDEASFDRNVDLLYSDDDGRANPFPAMHIHYEAASRTLLVSPGKTLEPGRELRLALYRNVKDKEGLPLSAAAGADEIVPQAAVVLTFFTAKP